MGDATQRFAQAGDILKFASCQSYVYMEKAKRHTFGRARFLMVSLVCSVRDFATFAELKFTLMAPTWAFRHQLYLLHAKIDSGAAALKFAFGTKDYNCLKNLN